MMVLIAGCGRFEEGPFMSFRSVKNRVDGTWQLSQHLENGGDSTLAYLDGMTIVWTFDKKEMTLEYTYRDQEPRAGTWEVNGTDLIVRVEQFTPGGDLYMEDDTLHLTRLTNKEMWIKFSDTVEEHFEAQK